MFNVHEMKSKWKIRLKTIPYRMRDYNNQHSFDFLLFFSLTFLVHSVHLDWLTIARNECVVFPRHGTGIELTQNKNMSPTNNEMRSHEHIFSLHLSFFIVCYRNHKNRNRSKGIQKTEYEEMEEEWRNSIKNSAQFFYHIFHHEHGQESSSCFFFLKKST